MAEGWIKLYRQIQESDLWNRNGPFDFRSAWIDLLLSVKFQDDKVYHDTKVVQLERGSMLTSERDLAARWGWSQKRVRNFLSLLEQDAMVVVKRNHRGSTLKLVNYGLYQDVGITKGITEESLRNHSGITEESLADFLPIKEKNVKNGKKEKNICATPKKSYAEFVSMTERQYELLVEKVGEDGAKRCIEILDNYKGAHGKHFESDFHVMNNWVIKRYNEERGSIGGRNGDTQDGGRPKLNVIEL